MNVYQEVTLLPDLISTSNFLWKRVFPQVHLALVEMKGVVGISFPEYRDKWLGNKLRVFAESDMQLDQLNLRHWLRFFADYTHVTSIRQLPVSVRYARYRRIQVKTNKERLARRRAVRHNLSYEQALKDYDNFIEPRLTLPYINMKSVSAGVEFKLFISKELVPGLDKAGFTSYGLSSRNKWSSVPEF